MRFATPRMLCALFVLSSAAMAASAASLSWSPAPSVTNGQVTGGVTWTLAQNEELASVKLEIIEVGSNAVIAMGNFQPPPELRPPVSLSCTAQTGKK